MLMWTGLARAMKAASARRCPCVYDRGGHDQRPDRDAGEGVKKRSKEQSDSGREGRNNAATPHEERDVLSSWMSHAATSVCPDTCREIEMHSLPCMHCAAIAMPRCSFMRIRSLSTAR